jgi:DNA-binding IclR family transcriptional regulator
MRVMGPLPAFPIFNRKGEILASLSIQSTVNRLNKTTRPSFLKEGIRASQKITHLLEASPL